MYPPLSPWNPGDHLRVNRGLYWHHAIYIGGDHLVEFGSSIWGGVARLVSYRDFARDHHVERVVHAATLPPDEIVRRAVANLGLHGFDVVTRNCEHFATWCATDQWRSQQVVNVAVLLGFAAVGRLLAKAA